MSARDLGRLVRFKNVRPQYGIATLLVVTAASAVFMSLQVSGLQEQRTRAVYDAQKVAVDDTIDEFTNALRSNGYDVENRSSNTWGSGEWIKTAEISARQGSGTPLVCYVEVQGFVLHDADNKPTWRRVLPMKISHRDHDLDDQFVAILSAKLDENDWRYTVDDRYVWRDPFDSRSQVSHAAGAASSSMDSVRP